MAESRNEALLENMLGGDNVIVPPQSRNEAILYAIVNDLPSIPEPYTGTPQSRIEALLVELYEKGGGGGGQISPDPDSLKPIAAGIDANGVYISDTASDNTPILYGRDITGIYAQEVSA